MPTFAAVTRTHILRAIEQYDELGADLFRDRFGFSEAQEYEAHHDGRTYDAKAIVGVAHFHATGFLATPEQFTAGKDGAARLLNARGFTVRHVSGADPFAVPAPVARARAPRAPRAASSPSRKATPPQPTAVCPTCFMALPATGICDNCA